MSPSNTWKYELEVASFFAIWKPNQAVWTFDQIILKKAHMRLMYKWISDITTLLQYNRVTSLEQLSLAEFSGEWYGTHPMINIQ